MLSLLLALCLTGAGFAVTRSAPVKRVEEIVATTNALHADMVAISGDLFDGFLSNLVQPTLPLAKLKSKYGVYYATGNHEYYYGDTNEWLHYFTTKLISPFCTIQIVISVLEA
uniref:Metallophos domain-containing protein n=1 Tax=Loa loa TaxID=7209 RepID=A0A1I7V788_LOALO